MAEPAADDAADYLQGQMPIEEQAATYRAFDGLVRFGSLGLACLLLFLVLMFCTHAGFLPAIVVPAILGAVGLWFLRKTPPSTETL